MSNLTGYETFALMKISTFTKLLLFAGLIWSCQADQTEEKSIYQTWTYSDSAQVIPIDTNRSVVSWILETEYKKMDGIIKLDSGEVALMNGEVSSGRMFFDMQSIEIRNYLLQDQERDSLNDWLRLNVSFDSVVYYVTEIIKIDSLDSLSSDVPSMIKKHTHMIRGVLVMNDVQNELEFPVRITDQNPLKIESRFPLIRPNWPSSQFSNYNPLLSDTLDIAVWLIVPLQE